MTEREKRELHLILGHYVNLLDRPEIKDGCMPLELLANKDLQSIAVKNMDRIARELAPKAAPIEGAEHWEWDK